MASAGATGWVEPNERTVAVDAALVRCCRAADAVAVAYTGSTEAIAFEVETARGSMLSWTVPGSGTWMFREGSWADEYGRLHRSGLLRPTLRGVARAARPNHDAALDVLVRDVEFSAGALIAAAEEHRRGTMAAPVGTGPEQLLERTWPALTADERGALWKLTKLIDVQAGCRLMVRDEQGHDVLFLLAGRLRVDTGQGEVFLAPGSVVGEVAALGNGVRTADVETVSDCVLLAASGHDLAGLPEAVRDQIDRKVLA
jgi:hypothetical protein